MVRKSRRQRRRTSSRKRPYVLGSVLFLFGGTVLLILGFSLWVKRYLHSDDFRLFMSRSTSEALDGEGSFSDFKWTGSSFHSNDLRLSGLPNSAYDELRLSGIRANVDFGSFRQDAWEVSDVAISRLELLVLPDGDTADPSPIEPAHQPSNDRPEENKSFWSKWLPEKVRISEIDVSAFEFIVAPSELRGDGIRMALTPLSGDEGWNVRWTGGVIQLGDSPEMSVDQLHARIRGEQLFLTDATFDLETGARLSMNGDLDLAESEVALTFHVENLKADKVLRPDWKQRLNGTLHGDFDLRGNYAAGAPLTQRGRFWLKNGILQALPVLDHIAEHTRTERFRRLILDHAEAQFERVGEELWLTNVVLQSDGLIRIEGEIHIGPAMTSDESRPLSGQFQVGVVRDTLKWLPGAEAKVFTEERDGYVWTSMGLAGTLEEPEEDLTARLRGAAFETAVEEAPLRALEAGQGIFQGASGLVRGAANVLTQSGGEESDDVTTPGNGAKKMLDTTESLVREGLRFLPLLGAD